MGDEADSTKSQERQSLQNQDFENPLAITASDNKQRTSQVVPPPEVQGQQNVMRGLNSRGDDSDQNFGNENDDGNNDDNDDQRPSINASQVTTNRKSTPKSIEMTGLNDPSNKAGGRKRKVTRKNSKKIKIASQSKKPKKIKGKRISIKKKFSKTKHKKK